MQFSLGQSSSGACVSAHITDIHGSDDVIIDCAYGLNNDCVTLEVAYTSLSSTENYEVIATDFTPPIAFDQGTPLIATMVSSSGIVDDIFSQPIPLSFDFCFYDQVFSEIIIGSNGVVTFDKKYASTTNPSAIPNENPHPSLIDNAIFGVQHDLIFDISDDSEIYYSTVGEAPCRQFIINYYQGNTFQCDNKSTTQIVLHETTNEIDIHILQKPMTCDNGRENNALLGIINSLGTQGVSPTNRNTGTWSAAQESWKFKPIGARLPIIQWKDGNGNIVGQGERIEVCPEENTVYRASVQYRSCVGQTLEITDDISITYDALYPVIETNEFNVCDQNNDGSEYINLSDYNDLILPDNQSNFIFTYYDNESNAQNQNNAIVDTTLAGTKNLFVRIQSTIDSRCYIIEPLTFHFTSTDIPNLTINICDNNNDLEELDVNLINYINNILANSVYLNYSIHHTAEDATNQNNVITSADIIPSSQIWINLQIFEGCEKVVGPISFQFKTAPDDRTTQTITRTLCDINFDGIETFDWNSVIRDVMVINPGETFTVHRTRNRAVNNSEPQTTIEDKANYFVRIMNSNGCFTVIKQPIDITFKGIQATNYEKYICFDGEEDIAVNLTDFIDQMNLQVEGFSTPVPNIELSYFDNEDNANNNTNAIISSQTITTNGYKVEKTFFVRFEINGCYSIRTITLHLIHPSPQQNPVFVCDIFNDNSEFNTLSSYDAAILGDQEGTVAYYLSQADAQDQTNALDTYDFPMSTTLYVVITSHGCQKTHPIQFNMTSVEEVQDIEVTIGSLCDSNNDGVSDIDLTSFNSQVYTGSNASYHYYKAYDKSTKILSEPLSAVYNYNSTNSFSFYVAIDVDNEYCNAIAKVTVNFDDSKIFEIADKERSACDLEGDLNEEFDLNQVYTEYLDSLAGFNPDNYTLSFHRTEAEAQAAQNPMAISLFTPNAATFTIYVRAYHKITGCLDIRELILHTYSPPKPIAGEIAVCDTNLDASYDVVLSELNQVVMLDTEGYNFSYYWDESDAYNSENPLDSNKILELTGNNSIIWVRVERKSIVACFDVKPVTIKYNASIVVPIKDYEVKVCDQDSNGISTIDLTILEAEFPPSEYTLYYYENFQEINDREDPIADPSAYVNTIPYQKTVYVMVEREDSCPNFIKVDLVFQTIDVSVAEENYFCPSAIDGGTITPDVGDASLYLFEWFDQTGKLLSTDQNLVNVLEEQTFTLVVTYKNNDACFIEFAVKAKFYDVPAITDIREENNNVTVIATGFSPILYAIDGGPWQASNLFYNVAPGVHDFQIKYDGEECEGESKAYVILYLQSVITPNGDGLNDKFVVENLEIFGDKPSTLVIFNRKGTVIYEKSGNSIIEWDGTMAGRNLNTTDYWYQITLPDGRQKTGHISVKNQSGQE